MDMQDCEVLVIGAGMAGLGFAHAFDSSDVIVVEKEPAPGGCLRTDHIGQHLIDRTGHLFHSKEPRVHMLLNQELNIPWRRFRRDARIAIAGRFVDYPIQFHLGQLPPQMAIECVSSYIDVLIQKPIPGLDLASWARATFGSGLYGHFFEPYNAKIWACDLSSMTAEWAGRFVPIPDRETVLRGVFDLHESKDFGYNATFDYPVRGGSQTIADAFVRRSKAQFRFSEEIVRIEPNGRMAYARSGRGYLYNFLVTSMPLNKLLLSVLSSVPDDVSEAARQLRHTSVLYFAFSVEMDLAPPWHWVYVPDPNIPFYRVGILSNYAEDIAPERNVLFCVEVAFPQERVFEANVEGLRDQCWECLCDLGFIERNATLILQHVGILNPAYCIFDSHREHAVSTALRFLESKRIYSIGRYGRWEYGAIGDAILSGVSVADRLRRYLSE